MASDRDRAAIRQAYLDYLGREASEDDVEGWATGQFHGGGLDEWLNAIQNSGEGQAYQRDQADRVEEGRLQAIRDQKDRDAANRNQSNQNLGNMIPEGFSDNQTSGPENDPYAGGRRAGSYDPTPEVRNTTIPPRTGATGSASSQGGNTYQSASQQIQDAYRTYLGKDATPQDIANHLSGGRYFAPANVQHALGVIQNSEDARLYSASQTTGGNEDPEKADAKSQMQAAYLEHLEREMSDEEFEAWWDGTNEWGPAGIEGLPGWLRGVAHEGNRLKGLNTGPGNTGAPPPRTGQAPGGFDQTKWESGHGSMKYDAGGFLDGLTKPSEIDAMVKSAAFQDRFGGATFDGKDKINFNGIESDGVPVYEVDVLMRADQAGDTSGGFWWGAGSGDGTTDDTGDVDPGAVDPSDPSPVWAGFPADSPLAPPQLSPGPNTFGMGPGGGGMMGPGGGGMMGPGGGGGTMGNMMTPYNPLATYSPEPYIPPTPYRPPGYAAPAPFVGDRYQPATPYQQATYQGAVPFARDEYEAAAPYELPTAAEAAADPSYQFRLQQGLDALERSGAARGITNTGATMKGLFDYGANSASQEYASVDARKRDTYDTNERNRFNAYEANFGNAMTAYDTNERNRAGAFDVNERNRANAYDTNEQNRSGAYDTNYANTIGEYGINEFNRAGAFNTNVRNAETAYNTNERNRFQGYTTNEIARINENQTAENRRAGAYSTNARNFQDAQNFGLRAQNQGWRQGYDKWVAQYNQQRTNRRDNFDMFRNLGGAQ
jgi:hypothetical protein